MSDNIAFNVFIGLVFVFLLYSLLATIVQEILASWLNLRSRMLQKGIRRMLQDQEVNNKFTIIQIPLEFWRSIVYFFAPYSGKQHSLLKIFYQYPTIKYLAESSLNNKPSYIDASTFSQTMVYILQGSQGSGAANSKEHIKNVIFNCRNVRGVDGELVDIDRETCEHLARLWNDAQGETSQFRVNLEAWFNQTMDRVSGWYTRQTKLMLFVIGLVIAFSFNVDCIAISKHLAKDDAARNDMVQLAISRGDKQRLPDGTRDDKMYREAMASVRADIDRAGNILSISAVDNDSCRVCRIFDKQMLELTDTERKLRAQKDTVSATFAKNKKRQDDLSKLIIGYRPACTGIKEPQQAGLLGCVLTALAISLGSSFWFDLLKRLVQIRGAGNKPESKGTNTTSPTTPPLKPLG